MSTTVFCDAHAGFIVGCPGCAINDLAAERERLRTENTTLRGALETIEEFLHGCGGSVAMTARRLACEALAKAKAAPR